MQYLIIEDEQPAAKRLSKLVNDRRPDWSIVEVIDSVSTAVNYLNNFEHPDLIFMDIQLSDGLSFDIFTKVDIKTPVIFTTAFDQYALKAFKVNSIDYLLKPIDPEELDRALNQYDRFISQDASIDMAAVQKMISSFQQNEYKSRFLVKMGQALTYVELPDIAYFYAEDGVCLLQTISGKKHVIDFTLDQLESKLDPSSFFRINRKFILELHAIRKIQTYFNSRLVLTLEPGHGEEIIVSRDRVASFKRWLDQ